MDGLILATDLLYAHKAAKNVSRRIFLITDAATEVNADESEVEKVLEVLKAQEISLFTIGIDFDPFDEDLDYDSVADPKRRNEYLLYNMCEVLNGVVIPLQSALQALAQLRAKTVRQVTTFRGVLEIGGPGNVEHTDQFAGMGIRLWGYLKTKPSTMLTLSKSSAKARKAKASGDCAIVTDRRYFCQDDPDAEVDASKKIKAYRYGRSLVPFGTVDEQVLKFETTKSMKLLGFTPKAAIRHADLMGQCYIFAAPPGDSSACMAVASLAHAMYEMEMVAIVRYVRCRNAQPYLGVLFPKVKPDREFFYFNTLPFSEDLRQYPFNSPADTKQRLRTAEKDKLVAMEALVASLDLMKADHGQEALKPKAVFNPGLQHLYQAVRHRALHPSAPMVELDRNIAAFARAWEMKGTLRPLLDAAQPAMAKVRALFPTVPVEAGREKKRYWFATNGVDINLESYAKGAAGKAVDMLGLDITGLPEAKRLKGNYFDPSGSGDLSPWQAPTPGMEKVPVDSILTARVSHVGTVNPVKDFQDMFNRRDEDLVLPAIEGMLTVIHRLLRDSINDQYYEKVSQCIEVLREGCVREDEAGKFNPFLKELKRECTTGRRADFWDKYVKAKCLTLITDEEVTDHGASLDEAKRFLEEEEAVVTAVEVSAEASEEDLFEDLV
eukprot:GGOE01001433.1.p1 GENE.GGOE01001433.1~~GGOE01001433.1.p1  ORF type:complete len:777 (-),score=239.27 GGOE01001433.1:160-2154(-)